MQGTRNGGEAVSWLVPSLQCSQCARREAGVRSWVQIAPGNVVIFECCAPADGTSAARCMNGDFGTSRLKKAAREQATSNEAAWGEAEGHSDASSAARRHAPAFGQAPRLLDLREARAGAARIVARAKQCPTRDPS